MKKHIKGYTVVNYIIGIFFVLILNACSTIGYVTTSVSNNRNIIDAQNRLDNYNVIVVKRHDAIRVNYNNISPYNTTFNLNNCRRNVYCKCLKN
mgnify:CR=1 FL=1